MLGDFRWLFEARLRKAFQSYQYRMIKEMQFLVEPISQKKRDSNFESSISLERSYGCLVGVLRLEITMQKRSYSFRASFSCVEESTSLEQLRT